MSSGRSFASVDEGSKTPEERLAYLEQCLPVLTERMQSYDRLIDENSLLRQQVSDLKDNVGQVASSVSDHSRKFDEFSKSNDAKHKKSECDISSQEASKKNIQTQLDDMSNVHRSLLSSVNDDRLSLAVKLQDLQASIPSMDAIKSLHQKLQLSIDDLQSKHIDIIDRFQENMNWRGQTFNNLLDINKKLDACSERDTQQINSINIANDTFKSLESNVYGYVKGLLDDHRKTVESKIENVKSLISESPNTAEAVKSELSSKIEMIALDGRNAVLKANNSSQQIALLEKKIENLYLLLKKYELNQ